MHQMTYTPPREVEKILDGFRLLDDTFMTLFFDQNFEATTLLLNVILERSDIRVKRMELQKVEKNPDVDGRNVTLDILQKTPMERTMISRCKGRIKVRPERELGSSAECWIPECSMQETIFRRSVILM